MNIHKLNEEVLQRLSRNDPDVEGLMLFVSEGGDINDWERVGIA